MLRNPTPGHVGRRTSEAPAPPVGAGGDLAGDGKAQRVPDRRQVQPCGNERRPRHEKLFGDRHRRRALRKRCYHDDGVGELAT